MAPWGDTGAWCHPLAADAGELAPQWHHAACGGLAECIDGDCVGEVAQQRDGPRRCVPPPFRELRSVYLSFTSYLSHIYLTFTSHIPYWLPHRPPPPPQPLSTLGDITGIACGAELQFTLPVESIDVRRFKSACTLVTKQDACIYERPPLRASTGNSIFYVLSESQTKHKTISRDLVERCAGHTFCLPHAYLLARLLVTYTLLAYYLMFTTRLPLVYLLFTYFISYVAAHPSGCCMAGTRSCAKANCR